MHPIFSIITPSFNKANYIKEMVTSVLAQTESSWELIIIDDASTDGTTDIIKTLASTHEKIKIALNVKNRGANHCRNQGIEVAQGKYIIFFDADDLMAKHCLAQRKKAILSEPNADLWLFNMGLFNKKLGDLPASKNWIVPKESTKYLSLFLKHQIPWSIMQSTWKTNFLKKIGGFDLNFKKLQDLEIHTTAILEAAIIIPFQQLPVDVFYRIDEERKNFNALEFQKRLVQATCLYYRKFYKKVSSELHKKELTHTLLETLAGLCWQLKQGNIKKTDFNNLHKKIISTCQIKKHERLLFYYQKISVFLPFHLRGLKWGTSFMLK